ncbi:hypothetical protein ACQP1O_22425 [Nocardia sp. CA-151230]|uniref:hypothetical protein n=1 Tax=Nocardia sp. CA-151230 TaxID=3239982 RepID=UPI003D8C6EBC
MSTKMTFAIPDSLVEPLRKHAGPNRQQSEFVARAIRRELLRADVAALAAAEAAAGGADVSFELAFQDEQESGL